MNCFEEWGEGAFILNQTQSLSFPTREILWSRTRDVIITRGRAYFLSVSLLQISSVIYHELPFFAFFMEFEQDNYTLDASLPKDLIFNDFF